MTTDNKYPFGVFVYNSGRPLHIVALTKDQEHIFREIKDGYLVFYVHRNKIVRDGDDGVYLSREAQDVILSLYSEETIGHVPDDMETVEVEILME